LSALALSLRQARYETLAFFRNPAAAFFTLVFPLMFLIIFNLIFGDEEIDTEQGSLDTSTFYVPAIVAMSVISACYTNVAIGTAFARDRGVLKRVRGTPLPPAAFLAGRILQATFVALLLVAIVLAMGAAFYGVELPGKTFAAFIVTLIVGAATFCALGLAVTAIIPNADASPAVANATVLPLLFISDVFIPMQDAPAWLSDVASLFPVAHFASALHTTFSPFETGAGFEWKALAVMAAWCAVGVALSLRFFSWEPRK
jgi:ABC-2 type transport system permease protein